MGDVHKCILITVAHLLGFKPGQLLLDQRRFHAASSMLQHTSSCQIVEPMMVSSMYMIGLRKFCQKVTAQESECAGAVRAHRRRRRRRVGRRRRVALVAFGSLGGHTRSWGKCRRLDHCMTRVSNLLDMLIYKSFLILSVIY